MSNAPRIITVIGLWLRNILVLLAWAYAGTIGFTLASCTSGDPFSWALLVLFVLGAVGWPVTVLAVAGALALAIIRPHREGASAHGWLRTAVAVAAVLAFIGAAAGFGDRGSCSLGGF
ncbi:MULTISPECIES: hypothetical protein [unclassified Inquilinus]|uniref:hypothetical protein n=1 Tax=unclassified Inquilinus TaxID=2645927 RepID=UPI003F8FB57C